MIQRRILLSPCPASPVKSELPLCTSAMRLPSSVSCFILCSILARKTICPSLERGHERKFGIAAVFHQKAGIAEAALVAQTGQIALPTLAVGRVGEHEVKFVAGESVRCKCRAVMDVSCVAAVPLEDQIRLADGVCLRVDLLTIEMDRCLLALGAGPICPVYPRLMSTSHQCHRRRRRRDRCPTAPGRRSA